MNCRAVRNGLKGYRLYFGKVWRNRCTRGPTEMIRGIIEGLSLSLSRIPAPQALSPDRWVKTLIGALMSAKRSSPCDSRMPAHDSYYCIIRIIIIIIIIRRVARYVLAAAFTRSNCESRANEETAWKKSASEDRGRDADPQQVEVALLDMEYLLCRCRHTHGFKSMLA